MDSRYVGRQASGMMMPVRKGYQSVLALSAVCVRMHACVRACKRARVCVRIHSIVSGPCHV